MSQHPYGPELLGTAGTWVGPNGKRTKQFSSANGAKTDQTVRGGAFFRVGTR